MKKALLTAAGLVAVVAFIVGTYALMVMKMIAAGAAQVIPPVAVTTMEVKEQVWQPSLSSVGTLSAVQGVTLSAQLDGTVASIAFESGSRVKAGDLLLQMDVSAEQAQLKSAQAAAELARLNADRSRELLAKGTVSQQQFDQDSAALKQAVAAVENIQAVIAKKTIRAPFAGRLGVRLVNLGQTLKAGDAIVSLQALDPIFVDFFLPQQQLGEVSAGLAVSADCDAFPGSPFQGRINAVNPDVDPATRNVRVQATLPNADERLHPGMFVTVNVLLPTREKVLAVPVTSVLYAPYGDSVFVVVPGKDPKTGAATQVAESRLVRLGRKQGDFVSVISGVKEGDVVVTTGSFKLRNGVTVSADNSLAPDAQLAPKPTDS
jgi:membrane fusion protein (multidrug efflux system)